MSELLLRHSLDGLGVGEYPLDLRTARFGKPSLANYPGIHFNISHAGRWVVCAVSSEEVGVDVEQIRSIDLAIARRFFAPSEYTTLMSLEAGDRLDFFFRLWTIKESYLKALGTGLHKELSSFCVEICPSGDVSLKDPHGYAKNFKIAELFLDNRHKLALCTSDSPSPYSLTKLEFDDFVRLSEGIGMLRPM